MGKVLAQDHVFLCFFFLPSLPSVEIIVSWFVWNDERRENFLSRINLVCSVCSVPVPPPCYRSGTLKTPVSLPKVQVAGYT